MKLSDAIWPHDSPYIITAYEYGKWYTELIWEIYVLPILEQMLKDKQWDDEEGVSVVASNGAE